MVNYVHEVNRGEKAPRIVNVVIEIPMGSRNKYEIDRETGFLKLDRVIHSPFHYPTDYGFIPQTWERDNDPLDAMVLTHHPVFPFCIVEAKPIGMLRMEDEKGTDDKILCIPTGDPRFEKIRDIKKLPPHWLKEIAHFFERYKELEEGKYSKVVGWFGSTEAMKCIAEAMRRYDEKFKR
ncbi:inorganic pyrophosphatase [Candidatus Bathyarchaeota archaeon]|nr:MAG: inorganic pyrophosphatase [Candidatus Bathyarchaeota archaeon]